MRGLPLILLLLPLSVQASCLDNDDPAYNLAVSQGDYAKAFHLIARELRLSSEEEHHFKIIQGFSWSHDDRHGQADPENLELDLDPGLFIEGKEGACQGMEHERTHLHQFQHDRRQLHAFFSSRPVPEGGWNGCARDTLAAPDADQAEEDAYGCLQDNDLAAHAAAMDIEAVLAQIPYARQKKLRDEDLNYLVENLTRWSDHQEEVTRTDNQSYYLPEIKQQDVRTFCKGTHAAIARLANVNASQGAWNYFCRGQSLRG